MLLIGLVLLMLGLTALSIWRRGIVFSMAAAVGWTAVGVLMLTDTDLILEVATLDEGWAQILAFLPFLMAFGSMTWYIGGIGRTKITMTDSRGKSWEMWGKQPKEEGVSRSLAAKIRHRERLKGAVDGRRYKR